MVVGSVCPLPPLSSGGAQVTLPWLRFHIPLIEPDWRISRIRLSDRTSRLHQRRTASKLCEAHESEVPVQVRGWKASTPPSPRLVLVTEPPTQRLKSSTTKFDQIDVRFLRNDVAIAHVHWELLGDARTQNPRRGVFLFVLTRQSGAWLIAVAQNTEINRTVK